MTSTKNGLLVRRLGLALAVSALPIVGFFTWLKVKHGITYLGPVPTLTFWVVPLFAGLWLVHWRQPITSRQRWGLWVCTAGAAICVAALWILPWIGLE